MNHRDTESTEVLPGLGTEEKDRKLKIGNWKFQSPTRTGRKIAAALLLVGCGAIAAMAQIVNPTASRVSVAVDTTGKLVAPSTNFFDKNTNELNRALVSLGVSGGGGGGNDKVATNNGTAFNLKNRATGSTTFRSIDDRFAEVRNVKDFGAVVDGVTDDTAAIAAAAAALTDGGTLLIPGTSLVRAAAGAAAITISNLANITITGSITNDELGESSAIWKTITAMSSSGSNVTATTALPHGISVGTVVAVYAGGPNEYRGAVTITAVPDSTHFQYATISGASPAVTTGSGTMKWAALDYDRRIFSLKKCKNVSLKLTFNGQPLNRSYRHRIGYRVVEFNDSDGTQGSTVDTLRVVANGASYGVSAGVFESPYLDHLAGGGLSIIGTNVGYPIAGWGVSNITVKITAQDVHRGFYLDGVADSIIDARVKDFDIAGGLIASHYLGSGTNHFGGRNVTASVTDTGTTTDTSWTTGGANYVRFLAGIQEYNSPGTATFENIHITSNLKQTDAKGFNIVPFDFIGLSTNSNAGVLDKFTLDGFVDRSQVSTISGLNFNYEMYFSTPATFEVRNVDLSGFRVANSSATVAQTLFGRTINLPNKTGFLEYRDTDSADAVTLAGGKNKPLSDSWYVADASPDTWRILNPATKALIASLNGTAFFPAVDNAMDLGAPSQRFQHGYFSQGLQAQTLAINDDTYNASTWLNSTNVPTKNAIRNKIEGLLDVDNIAGLVALDPTKVKKAVHVLGYYAAGDGGEGVFYWNSSAVNLTNYGTCFQAGGTGSGRWFRVTWNKGPVNALWFGLVPDGTTDNQARLTAALGQVPAFGSLEIPANFTGNVYALATPIVLTKSNYTIRGGGTLKATGFMSYVLALTGSNIRVEEITLEGNSKSQRGLYFGPGKLQVAENVKVYNCYLDNTLDPAGTGIVAPIQFAMGCSAGRVIGCTLSNSIYSSTGYVFRTAKGVVCDASSWASSSDDSFNFRVIDNTFYNIIGDGIGDGDVCSFFGNNGGRNWDLEIRGNHVFGYAHRGFKLYGPGQRAIGNYLSSGFYTNVYAGISCYSSNQIVLGNQIYGYQYRGIDTGTAAGPTGVIIRDNQISCLYGITNGSQGIALEGAVTNAIVTGNQIRNAFTGIFAGGDVYQSQITDNTIRDAIAYGIVVNTNAFASTYPTDLTISRNKIYNAATNAISINGATNVIARFNEGTSGGTYLVWNAVSGSHYQNPGDDDPYNATTWDNSLDIPTKNAIRDKIESLSLGGGGAPVGTVVESGIAAANKLLKTADTTGTNVVAAVSGTDYAPATSGSALLKGNGSGGFSNASSGTDYAPATSGSALLKGNGSGGFSSATAETDYVSPSGAGTLSNKRITERVHQQTDTGTLTPDFDTYGTEEITALAQALSIANPTGTPINRDRRDILLTTAAAQNLTWPANIIDGAMSRPTATEAGKTTWVVLIYLSAKSKYVCMHASSF